MEKNLYKKPFLFFCTLKEQYFRFLARYHIARFCQKLFAGKTDFEPVFVTKKCRI